MSKSRFTHLFLSLTLVLALVGGFIATQSVVFAQEATTTTTTPPSLTMDCKYPVLSNDSGQSYTFSVDVKYAGPERKTFELNVNTPEGWSATTTAGYPESQVSAVQITPINPDSPATETIKVNIYPNLGKLPDPGDYKITVKATSGTLTQSIDLTARVKAKYSMYTSTDTGNLTTQAEAGKENHFSFNLTNTGSAAIDKINLTSTKPDGWIVTFKPDKVETLGSGQISQVDVVITPPEGKTIAGDYIVTLKADNGTVFASNMDVRVTVVTPTIWGWVGIIIVVVVIAGLAILFMRLGRR